MEPTREGYLGIVKYELEYAGCAAHYAKLVNSLNRGFGAYKNIVLQAYIYCTSQIRKSTVYVLSIFATVSSIGVGFTPFSARSRSSVGSSIWHSLSFSASYDLLHQVIIGSGMFFST
jgi:hypothetical protein